MAAIALRRALSIGILLSSLILTFTLAPGAALAGKPNNSVPFGNPGQIYDFNLTTGGNASLSSGGITKPGAAVFNFTFVDSNPSPKPSDTGSANITVCKEVGWFPKGLGNPQNIRITMTYNQVAYNVATDPQFQMNVKNITGLNQFSCIWVEWTIPHFSTWQSSADLSLAVQVQAPVFPAVLPLLTVATLASATYLASRRRKLN